MAMKNYVIITLVFACLLLSCEKNETNDSFFHDYRVDDVLYPQNAKLKQVSTGWYLGLFQPEAVWYLQDEYEYDDFGRIGKVSRLMYEDGKIVGVISYDTYIYNDKNQLEKIMHYHLNLDENFFNQSNEIYTYDNYGNKIKMQIEDRGDAIYYHYDNNRLVRKEYYDRYHNKVLMHIKYEYNKGKLVKEIFYSTENNKPYRTVVHSYKNYLNVKTEEIDHRNDKLRETRRYYDKNDNLIYLESEELSLVSSATSFISMYEYY